jgi:hypothetical protein
MTLRVALPLAAAGLLGCHALLMDEPSPDTPTGNFDALWRGFDRYYCSFPTSGVDWHAQREAFRPRVRDDMAEPELFALLCEMTDALRDGHVSLSGPGVGTHSMFPAIVAQYPRNYDQSVARSYLGGTLRSGGSLTWGDLPGNVGYLHVASFGGGLEGIDAVLRAMQGRVALVVDVRDNGGGSSDNALLVAARFADQARTAGWWVYRSGPGQADFTAPAAFQVQPGGEHFGKPVAVLTNRSVFSAAELFLLAMRVLPQVTLVGDSSGGGAGNPVAQRLPNGWEVRVPRGFVLGAGGERIEGIGIPPAVRVDMAPADAAAGRDTILETALKILAAP